VAIASGAFLAEGGCTVSEFLHPAHFAAWIFQPGFSWGVWLPYLFAAIILAIGLPMAGKQLAQARGIQKVVALGPVFIGAPMAVFSAEHFTATKIIAGMVPGWIPGHVFWALLVGVCLLAAALSIAARKQAWLSSALLGVMILLFVLLIHIPNIAGAPHERILWVVALRDLTFSAGAFSLAAAEKEAWRPQDRHWVVTVARLVVGAVIVFMGVQQILHPELVPGVPLLKATPAWIPGHLLWGYVTGVIYLICGVSLIINKQARLAASWLGLVILLLVILIYVPIVVANPSDIGNALNYLADTLLLDGTVLALAGALDADSLSAILA
jgi:uncharacterized membrane protein